MSADGDDGPGRREVAYRLFAAEFEDADFEYKESDEERAPNYVVTPTGARVNRLFVVGVLTEVESVSDDVLRGRVVDPTGAFVTYAGQYQQDERAFFDRAEPPAFVALTGKARTFQPEDSDRVFTSVRPESTSYVDGDTRDRWTVEAAERTIERVRAMATAIELGVEGDRLERALVERGVEEGHADGIVQALDHYETTPTYLAAVRDLAVDAARHVAGDLDEVPGLTTSPADAGDVRASDLLDEPIEALEPSEEAATPNAQETETGAASTRAGPTSDATASTAGGATDTGSESTADVSSETAERTERPGSDETTGETTPRDTAGTGAEAAAEAPEDAETSAEQAETDTAGATAEAGADGETEGPGDFEPEEFELDEDEREQIESEYGTEFQSGTEVEEPGEADIETPEPEAVDDVAAAESESVEESTTSEVETPDQDVDSDGSADSTTDGDSDTADAPEQTDDVDLVDTAVEVMEELDEGEGADRDAVVAAVTDRYGADQDAVADAVQEALMDGRCYEPDDGVLKPI